MTEIFKQVILKNLTNTLKSYSYTLVKTLEIESGTINCVFKKDENDLVIVTFSYNPTSGFQKHTKDNHYLNEGFYRKTINGINGYYGIITEADKEWEKFTYLLNKETLIITISRSINASVPLKDLVKDYLKP